MVDQIIQKKSAPCWDAVGYTGHSHLSLSWPRWCDAQVHVDLAGASAIEGIAPLADGTPLLETLTLEDCVSLETRGGGGGGGGAGPTDRSG